MTIADVKKNTEQRMHKSIETLKADLAKVRTGRAHAGILDHVQVDYYGNPTQLSQVANVTLIDARTIGVQPWEKKMVAVVEKAIRESGLGLNPQPDGAMIRVPIPELSQERRVELVKISGKYAEQARVAVRNVRRDAMDALKKAEKDGDITEDGHKGLSEKVQKLTDDHIRKIDESLAIKEKEVMQI